MKNDNFTHKIYFISGIHTFMFGWTGAYPPHRRFMRGLWREPFRDTPSGPRPVPQERPGPRWLDRREQNALLRAVERAGKPRDLAVVRLLLNTGLRVQELCALTWKDVALSDRKGLLTVRHGKGGKHRQVPLNHDARAALAALGYPQHAGQEAVILQGQRGPMTPRGRPGVGSVNSSWTVYGGQRRQFCCSCSRPWWSPRCGSAVGNES